MAYGLETFDASGNKLMDTGSTLPRLVGREAFTWNVGGADQTVTNASYAGGMVVVESSVDGNGNYVMSPVVKISGNDLICKPCTSTSSGNPSVNVTDPVVTTVAVYSKDYAPTASGYGLRVVNDDGLLQIDSISTNYFLLDSGTVTVPSGAYGFGAVNLDFSRDLNYPPLIFVKTANPVSVTNFLYGGSPVLPITGCSFSHPGGSSIDVDYKIYADARDMPAPTGYGLAVYRSDGSCCFNSNYQPLAIAGKTSVQPGLPPSGYSSWSHGVSNAYVLANYGFLHTLYSSNAYSLNVYTSGTVSYFGWATTGNFWRGQYPEAPTIYPMVVT